MDERRAPAPAQGQLDLRRTDRRLGSVVSGYGLTPSSARDRAVVVRAVTDDARIRQRPMPVVLVTALLALLGLGIWGWQLYLSMTENEPLSPLFWVGLVTFLGAAAVCSWAWQLYDVQKAIVMWVAIAVLGLAAVLILVVVLVAAKGNSDVDLDLDLDGLLDKITGSHAIQNPGGFVDHVVAPLVVDAADIMSGPAGGGATAEPPTAVTRDAPVEVTDGPACTACGRPITAGLTICPRCGAAVA